MGPTRQGLILMLRFLGRGRSRPTAILFAVAWGTLSMMMLLAFGEGLHRQIARSDLALGHRLVIVWGGGTTRPWEGMKAGRQIRIDEEDVAALRRAMPELRHVAGEIERWAVDIAWGSKSVSAHTTGVLPCYETMRSHVPRAGGRFLNEVDEERRRRVVFLGPKLAERLFGETEPVGRTVAVRGVPFTVVGVMVDKLQSSMYSGPDVEKASIPVSTMKAIFGDQPYDEVLYTFDERHDADEIQARVREVLARRHRFDPADEGALHFWDTVAGAETERAVMAGIKIFLGLVGGMTLLVAGVGLANMLFVIVHRRIREIGMQMAIGARARAVAAQIVGESLAVAGLGGYLGIGLSWLLVEAIQRVPIQSEGLQYLGKPTLSIPLGIATAAVLIGIGCLAGSLPARRAARLNPVEALRHE